MHPITPVKALKPDNHETSASRRMVKAARRFASFSFNYACYQKQRHFSSKLSLKASWKSVKKPCPVARKKRKYRFHRPKVAQTACRRGVKNGYEREDFCMKLRKAIVFLIFSVCLSSADVFGELSEPIVVDDFNRPDSLYHGHKWETLNPGYWKVENKALRRRLRNRGDWVQQIEFPFRVLPEKDSTYSIRNQTLPSDYPPSLPFGMIWRRDWDLSGNYIICLDAGIIALPPSPEQTEKSRETYPNIH